MNLSVHEFISRILPGLSDRQFAETPVEPGPRKRVKNFIADVRRQYAEKKKNLSPNDKRYRPSPIWYFFAIIFLVLSMQNLFAGTHVELISYSQFKSLLKKDLISDLVIRETAIDGNLKGAAVKEIFTPEKLKKIPPEVLEGKKVLPFKTVRVEDPTLTADLKRRKCPLKER